MERNPALLYTRASKKQLVAYGKIPRMKKAKKLRVTKEPTISDVLKAVQAGFEKVEEKFEGVESKLDGVETVLGRHEKILKTLVEGQGHLREDVHILDQRVSKTQNRIEDVVDEHQDSLREYGRRITVLERAKS